MPLHLTEDHLHPTHFIFDGDDLRVNSNAIESLVKNARDNITYSSPQNNTIITIPAYGIVTKVIVDISTAFDGSSPTLNIGSYSIIDKLVYSGDLDLTSQNTYVFHMHKKSTSSQLYLAFFDGGGSTTGELDIYLEYATI